MLHCLVKQHFMFHRPPEEGDPLRCASTRCRADTSVATPRVYFLAAKVRERQLMCTCLDQVRYASDSDAPTKWTVAPFSIISLSRKFGEPSLCFPHALRSPTIIALHRSSWSFCDSAASIPHRARRGERPIASSTYHSRLRPGRMAKMRSWWCVHKSWSTNLY